MDTSSRRSAPITGLPEFGAYDKIERDFRQLSRLAFQDEDAALDYRVEGRARFESDLYFVFRCVLSTRSVEGDTTLGRIRVAKHPHIFEMCRTVQEAWDNSVNTELTSKPTFLAWFRGAFKSTIGSFCLPLQVILRDPEETIMLLSVMKSLAEQKLSRCKAEMEANKVLKALYGGDRLWEDADKESASWSITKGLTLPRKSVRDEPTLWAAGFLAGQGTGTHPSGIILDDGEHDDTVTSKSVRDRSMHAYNSATFLADTLVGQRKLTIGTFYHEDGLHSRLVSQKRVVLQKRPAVDVSKPADEGFEELGGKSTFLSNKALLKLQREHARDPGHWGRQMMLDPKAGASRGFDTSNLRFYSTPPSREAVGKAIYILADPGGRGEDPSAFVAVGLGTDRNVYVLDCRMDNFSDMGRLTEFLTLHRKWASIRGCRVHRARYELSGQSSDNYWMKEVMNRQRYRPPIQWVGRGGHIRAKEGGRIFAGKNDRLQWALGPLIEDNRLYLPDRLVYRGEDMVPKIVGEIRDFPQRKGSDHFLDALSLLFLETWKYGEPYFPSEDYERRIMEFTSPAAVPSGRTAQVC